VHLQNAKELVIDLDSNKPTVIYIHGYLCNVESNDVIAIVSGMQYTLYIYNNVFLLNYILL
jgi:hypothetical protein